MNLAPVQVEHAHGHGARRPVLVDERDRGGEARFALISLKHPPR